MGTHESDMATKRSEKFFMVGLCGRNVGGNTQNSWGDLSAMETAKTSGMPITAPTNIKKEVSATSPPTDLESLL
jgi:hypothetical protein